MQAAGDLATAAAAAAGRGGVLATPAASSSSSCGGVPLVVAVTGSKGSGKSAFARLLVNHLLNQGQGQGQGQGLVAYLDLDPGQPEFTPPVGNLLTFHKFVWGNVVWLPAGGASRQLVLDRAGFLFTVSHNSNLIALTRGEVCQQPF